MLGLRLNYEYCDRDLPGDSGGVPTCTSECTFCRDCTTTRLNGRCPNCDGELLV